ncbi:MAG: Tex-like N-terminal domain-containing protein, partial [Bacteroidales bacterium]
MEKIMIRRIARETDLAEKGVQVVLDLLSQGATIPFIARYRKERTGKLDEEQIMRIKEAHKRFLEFDHRKQFITKSIEEQGKLTELLRAKLDSAEALYQLEDIYLPYKSKRKTRAVLAVEKGLKSLATSIMRQNTNDIQKLAKQFVIPSKGVDTVEQALKGAADIIAAWVNEHISARNRVRKLLWRKANICSKIIKGNREEEAQKYKDYFDFTEPLQRLPSHRYLAIIRGEKQGILKLGLEFNNDEVLQFLYPIWVRSSGQCASFIKSAVADAFKRLMLPSLETEIRATLKKRSDEKAIEIFKTNLYQLLMAPPLGQKRVMAIDPGFRSGCKVVCLDEQGNLLENDTIYPHPPQLDTKRAAKKVRSLAEIYKTKTIAVGNGTAGRETERFLQKINFPFSVQSIMVNESGASVYSVSKIAREEFPEYDVTVRGAVSIGRRLMDPLAELVKIEPAAIGVGQYQHDVEEAKLSESLDDTVRQCVNAVGVDVNTASRELLAYVSGIGTVLAKNIVEYRSKNGSFSQRDELLKVPKLGNKAFEQAAGFLQIKNGTQPLDQSAVHPESYYLVKNMAEKAGVKPQQLIRNKSVLKQLNPADFT